MSVFKVSCISRGSTATSLCVEVVSECEGISEADFCVSREAEFFVSSEGSEPEVIQGQLLTSILGMEIEGIRKKPVTGLFDLGVVPCLISLDAVLLSWVNVFKLLVLALDDIVRRSTAVMADSRASKAGSQGIAEPRGNKMDPDARMTVR